MSESYVDKVANELADLALADQARSGDISIVDTIGDVLGASSQTLQETYLTAVRVRRAEQRARLMLADRAGAPVVPLADLIEDNSTAHNPMAHIEDAEIAQDTIASVEIEADPLSQATSTPDAVVIPDAEPAADEPSAAAMSALLATITPEPFIETIPDPSATATPEPLVETAPEPASNPTAEPSANETLETPSISSVLTQIGMQQTNENTAAGTQNPASHPTEPAAIARARAVQAASALVKAEAEITTNFGPWDMAEPTSGSADDMIPADDNADDNAPTTEETAVDTPSVDTVDEPTPIQPTKPKLSFPVGPRRVRR